MHSASTIAVCVDSALQLGNVMDRTRAYKLCVNDADHAPYRWCTPLYLDSQTCAQHTELAEILRQCIFFAYPFINDDGSCHPYLLNVLAIYNTHTNTLNHAPSLEAIVDNKHLLGPAGLTKGMFRDMYNGVMHIHTPSLPTSPSINVYNVQLQFEPHLTQVNVVLSPCVCVFQWRGHPITGGLYDDFGFKLTRVKGDHRMYADRDRKLYICTYDKAKNMHILRHKCWTTANRAQLTCAYA